VRGLRSLAVQLTDPGGLWKPCGSLHRQHFLPDDMGPTGWGRAYFMLICAEGEGPGERLRGHVPPKIVRRRAFSRVLHGTTG
jgi:hypothetical protein